jgi:hypothetical protein
METMVRMVGEVSSIGFAGGEEIRPDEAGVFAVPAEHIETARSHGLREAPAPTPSPAPAPAEVAQQELIPAQESPPEEDPAAAQGEPQVDQQRRGKRGR